LATIKPKMPKWETFIIGAW